MEYGLSGKQLSGASILSGDTKASLPVTFECLSNAAIVLRRGNHDGDNSYVTLCELGTCITRETT